MAGRVKAMGRVLEDLSRDSGYGGTADSLHSSSLSLSSEPAAAAAHEVLPGEVEGDAAGGLGGGGEGLEYSRLPELEQPPWDLQQLRAALSRQHPSGHWPHHSLLYLSRLLGRPLLRLAGEAQRLSRRFARCGGPEVRSALRIVLPRPLARRCLSAGLAALSLHSMGSARGFALGTSARCGLTLSVGRFFRWMLDSRLAPRLHPHAAVYLAAATETLLLELSGRLAPPPGSEPETGSSPAITPQQMERSLGSQPDLRGLCQSHRHLDCAHTARGILTLPEALELSPEGTKSRGTVLSSQPEQQSMEQALLVTCVGNVAELSELVSRTMHHLQQVSGTDGGESLALHRRQGPQHWEPEALYTLCYFMHTPQPERETSSMELTRASLTSNRLLLIRPPLAEWVRVATAHTEHRRGFSVDSDDVRQASRILLPGTDCEPRRLNADDYSCASLKLDAAATDARFRQALGFHMLTCGRTDLVNQAICLLGDDGVNTHSVQGLTPLMYACARGDEAMVQMLLDGGADVNREVPSPSCKCPSIPPDSRHWTALTLAVLHGHVAIVQLLLDHGAHVEGSLGPGGENYSETPLQLASAAGDVEMVNLLLERGADPTMGTVSRNGMTITPQGDMNAFSQAAAHGHRNVFRKLLAHSEEEMRKVVTLEEILAEGRELPDSVHPSPSPSSGSRVWVSVLREPLYYSAEHSFLDISLDCRSLGVPWRLHSWFLSLETAFLQRRRPVIQCLLREFGSIKEEEGGEELLLQGLPLLFNILKASKNEAISQQLAAIFTQCYGPYPIPKFTDIKPKQIARLDPHFLNNKEMSDITFLVEGKPFYAHRVLLFTASPRFKMLLSSRMPSDNSHNIFIEISHIKYNIFKMVMQYLYHGGTDTLQIRSSDLLELMSAAQFFQLDVLQRHCELICTRTISVDSCVQIYNHAKFLGASHLAAFCEGYFLKYMVSLMENEAFKQLLYSCPEGSSGKQLLHDLERVLTARIQSIHLSLSKGSVV
ncbi:ankyrin repeat and BTB/POZ domain-containing protein 3-B isoform X3 [Mobula birostris]|uniref:ankyrin repeat and BTB/POZ domain-containing protein 3-B isoform X3 n=1 Tax=Mobula birostris TaxID=1983395 RepID=UPI003B285ED6